MVKIIGNPLKQNLVLKKIINKAKIDNEHILKKKDFREEILNYIDKSMTVLDIGKSMRDKFDLINCKEKKTLDINIFDNYPDYQFDLSENYDLSKTDLNNKFDLIICLAVLEHVYNPFQAIQNLKTMIKPNGALFGYVPFLYHYHAPEDLEFQDYFRFTKDSVSYLLKDFKEVKLYPVRGRLSSSMYILFGSIWKKSFEKIYLNQLIDRLCSNKKNYSQCSGFNFIAYK